MTCLLIHSVCYRRLNQTRSKRPEHLENYLGKIAHPVGLAADGAPTGAPHTGAPACLGSIRLFRRLFENLHAQWRECAWHNLSAYPSATARRAPMVKAAS